MCECDCLWDGVILYDSFFGNVCETFPTVEESVVLHEFGVEGTGVGVNEAF